MVLSYSKYFYIGFSFWSWNTQKIFYRNAYSGKYSDRYISKFLNSIFVQRHIGPDLTPKSVTIFRKHSQQHQNKTYRCIAQRLNFCKLRFIFQTCNRRRNYFRFKQRIPETMQSYFNYKSKSKKYTASYYGKTYKHKNVLVFEHQGVTPKKNKQVRNTLPTWVRKHMLNFSHFLSLLES